MDKVISLSIMGPGTGQWTVGSGHTTDGTSSRVELELNFQVVSNTALDHGGGRGRCDSMIRTPELLEIQEINRSTE
ncbi:hypothetical protein BDW59DRAFT_146969 [Aspergillus cavernicola]|uniref:Uncharacterized protein n=1 Tax=Aspergillus cavernicola TaxID=176166 RepID=A0ABR4IAF4_9EURO